MKKERTDRYYSVIYKLFLPVFRIVAFFAYGVAARPKKYEEPILVLSNHTSDMDFLVVASYISNHMYFVCDRHVVDKGLFGKLFQKWFNPIAVYKGSYKMREVMEIIRRVRDGSSILLFPEGRLSHNGRTQDIEPATAKLAKTMKCRLITFRSAGGYFKQPRWQESMNGGRLFSAGIVNEYSSEYVKNASMEELLAHIRSDLYVDAYEEQETKKQPFRFKHGAEGITRCYDVCPKCHGIDTLTVHGIEIVCTCGYKMKLDKYGFLRGTPGLVSTTAQWEELQNTVYRQRFESGLYFSEDHDVFLYEFKKCSRATKENFLCGERLIGYENKLMLGAYQFMFDRIEKMEIMMGGRWLIFGYDGHHYMLSDDNGCLNKYIELYRWGISRLNVREKN